MSRNISAIQTDHAVLRTDPLRRRICAILATPDPPLSVRDLAVELAAQSCCIPPRPVTAFQRRRHQIQLHHHQLPKLADNGLVSYNHSRRTVRITPAGTETLTAGTDSQTRPPRVAVAQPYNGYGRYDRP